MAPILQLCRVAEFSEDDLAARQALAVAVYPPAEWANWPGYQIEWSSTEWCVRVWDAGRLVSYLGVLLRDATVDGRPVRIGGIGGVKTHPAARRRGYAALGLQCAGDFFRGILRSVGDVLVGVGDFIRALGPRFVDFLSRFLLRTGNVVLDLGG